ncbi:Protein kinase domain-containing protein, variant 2 [Balamuthia mandrillaris]
MSSLFDFLDCLPPPLLPSASSSDSSSHYRQHQFFSSTTKKTGSHRYCWSINEEVGMQQLRLRLKEMVNQVKAILVELKQQLPLKVFASTRDVLISLALTMKYQVKEVIEAVKGYCNQQDVGKQLPQRRLITSSFFLVTATYDLFIAIERISAAVEMEGLIEQMARHILSMLHLINHTNNDKSERKQSRRIDSLPNQILLSCEKLLNAAAIRRCDVPYPLLQHDLSEKIKLVDEAVTSFVLLAQKFLQEEDTIAQTEATRSRRAQLKELSVKIASDLKHYVDTYTSATAISCSSSDSFLKDETPPRVFMQLGEQTLREVEQDSSLWEQVMTNNEAQMMNYTRSLISLFSDEDILSSWWRGREDSSVRQVITTADAIFALAFQQQKQHEEQSLTVSSAPPSSAVASPSPERKMQLQRACSWHQLRDTKQEQAHFRQGLQHFIQVIELAERRAWLEQRARLVEKKDEADLWWRTGQHLLTERMLCGGMQGIATACSLVVRQFFLSSLVASSSSTSNTIVKELLVAKEEDDEEAEPLTQPKNEQLNNTEAEKKEAKEQEQETPKKDVDKVLEMLRQKQKEIASGGESSARRVAGSRRARFRAAAAANGSGSGNGGENGRAAPSGARRRAGSQAGKQLLTSFFHSTDVMTFEEYNVTI